MTPAATSGGGTSPAAAGRAGACTRGLAAAEAAAWIGLLRTRERLMQELDRELEHEHGISLAEYDVLVQLEAADGHRLRMAELADAVLLTRSGLTRLVDRLEERGLVQRVRCPSDARGLLAELTGEGIERLGAAATTHSDGIRRLFLTRLDGDDIDRLAAIWEKIAR